MVDVLVVTVLVVEVLVVRDVALDVVALDVVAVVAVVQLRQSSQSSQLTRSSMSPPKSSPSLIPLISFQHSGDWRVLLTTAAQSSLTVYTEFAPVGTFVRDLKYTLVSDPRVPSQSWQYQSLIKYQASGSHVVVV